MGGRGEGQWDGGDGRGGGIRDIDPSMDSSGVWNFFADM